MMGISHASYCMEKEDNDITLQMEQLYCEIEKTKKINDQKFYQIEETIPSQLIDLPRGYIYSTGGPNPSRYITDLINENKTRYSILKQLNQEKEKLDRIKKESKYSYPLTQSAQEHKLNNVKKELAILQNITKLAYKVIDCDS